MSAFSFRPYDGARDEEPSLALWLRSWQKAYPDINFAGRLAWWREHCAHLLDGTRSFLFPTAGCEARP